jgi:5'-nucleotidase
MNNMLKFLTLSLAVSAQALNILVTNDDGFGASNIRELYRLLNLAGHNGLPSHFP